MDCLIKMSSHLQTVRKIYKNIKQKKFIISDFIYIKNFIDLILLETWWIVFSKKSDLCFKEKNQFKYPLFFFFLGWGLFEPKKFSMQFIYSFELHHTPHQFKIKRNI